jgi:hypothetical protein
MKKKPGKSRQLENDRRNPATDVHRRNPQQYSMLFNAGCLLLPCFHQYSPLLKPQTLSELNSFASICVVSKTSCRGGGRRCVWRGAYSGEDERTIMKKAVNVPEGFEIPCWLALGYPVENATRARQVDIRLEQRIHLNTF